MAEADDSVQLTKLRASMSLATNTLALQRAIKAAKTSLAPKACGPRTSHIGSLSSGPKPILRTIERS
jgi:hypothetical protein